MLGFEGSFQGLVAERDDFKVLVQGLAMVRQLQRQLDRLFEYLAARAEQLRDSIVPDQERIVGEIDRALCARTAAR